MKDVKSHLRLIVSVVSARIVENGPITEIPTIYGTNDVSNQRSSTRVSDLLRREEIGRERKCER
jgi:hypothetical protein